MQILLQRYLCIDFSVWPSVWRMANREVREISDPSALKALSHPLRVRLLATLREIGPATATELAKLLDTDTGSTSYHLRILARHGFVQDASGERRHPRERRWTAAHQLSSWSNTELAATAAGREAAALMRRRQVEVLIADVERFDEMVGTLDPSWVEVSGIGDLVVRLSAASLAELWEGFYAHLDELVARDQDDPEARPLSVVVAGFPSEAIA
jgi:DNA-binding transcriptional ArsR family regulator